MSEQDPALVAEHHALCDFHWSHWDRECSCGATRPKATWFDAFARDYAAIVAELRAVHE